VAARTRHLGDAGVNARASGLRVETLAISAGRPAPIPDGPLNVPITPASALQAGGASGYARDGHPPWEALEEVIGALEGGRALAFSSGMAAAAAAISLFPPNPTVVAPEVAYMDVRRSLLRLQELGRASVRLVDVTDSDAVIAGCDGADVLWLESPTNPLLGLADLPRLCAFARERRMLCVVDNTLATPLLQRPLDLGADVVVHSATKAMGGHSDLLLGATVVGDEQHWHTLREAREMGGATPGALETYLCLRGLRTLPLRLERSQANAATLAQRLSEHPEVHEVRYPGLGSHPQHDRARATLAGAGFMLTFRVRGAAARADALVGAVRVLTHATSLGGVETTLERRARYPAERGVPEDLLRVSVGCEHVEDLWQDLQQALDATQRPA
jgi:cystathionine gamma-synthase